jgi:membrane glycosyltransferase
MAIAHTVFMAGLPFGRALVWDPQRRAGHRVPWTRALARLWPQTLLGLLALWWAVTALGGLAAWLSPFFIGAVLAVPIAVASASPALGRWAVRLGVWRIPEERDPPAIVAALDLPAVIATRGTGRAASPRVGGAATESAE